MRLDPLSAALWLFGPGQAGRPGYLWPRWLFLRALGFIFLTAFYSLLFQIRGLIGPQGILPAGEYLPPVSQRLGIRGFWYAPTLLWLGTGNRAVLALCWAGLAAAVLLMLNLWPRAALVVCVTAFLSFVCAARDFSSYQSDGMLLEAGFLSWFFAPPGLRPRLGELHPPSRARLFMLRWECFRIYFESGVVKLASGDPQWRHLTAMDHYYENGPLPNWIGWYVQQLPHRFHAVTTLLALVVELGLVWMFFLHCRWRILLFMILTPFQIGIVLTANLGFINHLVLVFGVLLPDDRFLSSLFPRLRLQSWKTDIGNLKLKTGNLSRVAQTYISQEARRTSAEFEEHELCVTLAGNLKLENGNSRSEPQAVTVQHSSFIIHRWQSVTRYASLALSGLFLSWIFYNTTVLLLLYLFRSLPVPLAPVIALEPFRISNQFGLFAVMTTARYEIEFQGTADGQNRIPSVTSLRIRESHPGSMRRISRDSIGTCGLPHSVAGGSIRGWSGPKGSCCSTIPVFYRCLAVIPSPASHHGPCVR